MDRKMIKDSQKKEVYNFDSAMNSLDNINLNEAQEIVNRICSPYFPNRIPKVKIDNRHKGLNYQFLGNEITLTKKFGNLPLSILIHEIAHFFVRQNDRNLKRKFFSDELPEGHGPEFVGVYMMLLNQELHYGMEVMDHCAKINRVKYNFNSWNEIIQNRKN